MSQDKIVIINGRKYDAKTGLPLPADSTPQKRTVPSSKVHSHIQRSKTLARRVTKRPDRPDRQPLTKRAGRVMDVARSSKISRFAPSMAARTEKSAAPKAEVKKDLPPQHHPLADKARGGAKAKPAQKTPAQIKKDAIDTAMASAAKPVVARPSFFSRHPRSIVIIVVSLVVILVGGYLTYVNMPNLSVRFAAMQAGINATYPEYRPAGYSINGPVSFSDGEVVIKFKANTGNASFTIRQKESTWDSTAVLDNIVRQQAGDEYLTSQERGLTIYTFDGNGAWVNDGILYTIESNDETGQNLGHDTIRRIAVSM